MRFSQHCLCVFFSDRFFFFTFPSRVSSTLDIFIFFFCRIVSVSLTNDNFVLSFNVMISIHGCSKSEQKNLCVCVHASHVQLIHFEYLQSSMFSLSHYHPEIIWFTLWIRTIYEARQTSHSMWSIKILLFSLSLDVSRWEIQVLVGKLWIETDHIQTFWL